jgi:Phage integrase family
MEPAFQLVGRRSTGALRILVFDPNKRLHFALTSFAAEAVKRLSGSTARVYLNAVIPFFHWLEHQQSESGLCRCWEDGPEEVRRNVGDYLVERLRCKVREHYAGFRLVSLTDGTKSTVRVFLSALKLFYRIMRAQDRYRHANPLVDGPSTVLADLRNRIGSDDPLPQMPEASGVVRPRTRRLSDSYFKLVGESWVPQVIDDPDFPARIMSGGQRAGWRLHGECITRILFESGCRVSEAVGLSLGDWNQRNLLQEAQAFNKGSHGRRVKFIRFSAATAKLLRRCFDTERRQLDRNCYGLDDYINQAKEHGINLHGVPLFLSSRGAQLTAKAFREGCWNTVCQAAGIEADVHQHATGTLHKRFARYMRARDQNRRSIVGCAS